MDYRDLFDRDTEIGEVFTDYIHPRVDDFDEDKYATQVKVHSVIIGIAALISLITLLVTKWSIGGWVTTAVLVGVAVFYKFLWHSIIGYGTWLLARFGIYVWAATAVTSFVGGVTTKATGLFTLFFLSLLFLTVSIIITATGGLIRMLQNRTEKEYDQWDDEEDEPTPAELIAQKLPTALVDYYAPRAEYARRNDAPARRNYETEDEYVEALDEFEADIHEERLDNAYNHIISVKEDEKEEGVILVALETKAGTTDAQLTKLAPQLSAQLKAYGVEEYDYDTRDGFVGFRVYIKPMPSVIDKLTEVKIGGEFFTNNPVTDLFSVALAQKVDGTPYCLPIHHTLIAGLTGSGKGSPIQGLVCQYSPFVKQGVVRMWGIDPKRAEFKPFIGGSLFHRLGFDDDEVEAIICDFWDAMKNAQATSGRLSEVTPASPMNLLYIDEFVAFTGNKALQNRKDDNGVTVGKKLIDILAQGRSDNFFVIAATQEVIASVLGQYRTNFANRIALRLNTASHTDIVLGEGAVDGGAISHRIPPANKANGYRTAGIASVMEEDGSIVPVRFAYTSDDDIDNLVAQFPPAQVTHTHHSTTAVPFAELDLAVEEEQMDDELQALMAKFADENANEDEEEGAYEN